MNLISPVHLLFIAVFALVFIGPKRLPEVGRSLAGGVRVFREALGGGVDRQGPGAAREGDGARLAPPPAGPFV